jgi:hypothetical protein
MPLVGLPTVFVVACLADLSGTEETRWFTRRAFALLVLYTIGVDASTVAAVASGTWDVIPL